MGRWVAMLLLMASTAWAQPREEEPVRAVAPSMLAVEYPGGRAGLPVFVSVDWTRPQPGITRAVIVFHGLLRNADVYYAGALEAQAKAESKAVGAGTGTVMVAPQFLADFDLPAHRMAAGTLGWKWDRWARGEGALTPAPVSTFSAIDAVVEHLADRALFPDLTVIVVAGFSAGGQVVQRYAVVGEAEERLRPGVSVQYVVSDPSSYLYFTPERPEPAAACRTANDWHYGFGAGIPAYVTLGAAALEARYVRRHVTYLMGMADTDPNHRVLDKSCAGEAEGPQRFARGHAYYDMLRARHGAALTHVLIDVPGIAHEGNRMFASDCGLRVLFGVAGCGAP